MRSARARAARAETAAETASSGNMNSAFPAQVTIMSERRKFAPYGLRGGGCGAKGANILFSGGKKIALKSKVNLNVKPNDILRIETPGGGGYGRTK